MTFVSQIAPPVAASARTAEGIAITSGDWARPGFDSARSAAVAWVPRARSRISQLLAPGSQTSGAGPSTLSFQPRARASAASPADLGAIRTSVQFPDTFRLAPS